MKPSSFFIGAVDFFAAFIPGVVVTATVLAMVGTPLGALAPIADSASSAALALFASAYIVGSLLNAVASRVLDEAFDWLYAPGSGRNSTPKPATGTEAKRAAPAARSKEDPWPLISLVNEALVAEGVPLTIRSENNPYPFVRAYLHLALPKTAAEVERSEAEQKLFRTMTLGAVLLGAALAIRALPTDGLPTDRTSAVSAAFALVVGYVAFDRYLDLRRKTIRRAYQYFLMRGVGTQPRADTGSLRPLASADDEE